MGFLNSLECNGCRKRTEPSDDEMLCAPGWHLFRCGPLNTADPGHFTAIAVCHDCAGQDPWRKLLQAISVQPLPS